MSLSEHQNQIEQPHLTLGFMPLTDCAPLIIAQEKGFFKQQGLHVSLDRQSSWATMRDKLHAGVLDAAQLLSPMPIASTLGLNGAKANVIAPMVLSLNGNAITLSEELVNEIEQNEFSNELSIPMSAGLLKPIIEQRKKQGRRIKFATVYPHSCHYYQLCTWLEQSNVALQDVDIVIIPPVSMVEALQQGDIDGFCVGGPWNAKAVRASSGVTIATSCDIWPNVPEKVLGMLESWQQQNPHTTSALIIALTKACQWLSHIGNRFEAARILSQQKYVDIHLSVITPSLIGSCLVRQNQSPREVTGYNLFSASKEYSVNKPNVYYGQWLVSHMDRHQHLDKQHISHTQLTEIFRHDLYEKAINLMIDS